MKWVPSPKKGAGNLQSLRANFRQQRGVLPSSVREQRAHSPGVLRSRAASLIKSMTKFHPRRLSSVTACAAFSRKFPMYVLPIEEALKLQTLPPHEELLETGKLVRWEPGMGKVVFMSHT